MTTHFLDLAKKRYTTKVYNSEAKVSEKDIQSLKEILRFTPSSINSQPWKFIFVSDQEIKSKLAEVSYFNKDKINGASHLIVFSVCNDIEKFEQQIEEHLLQGAVDYYRQNLKPKGEAHVKSWLKNQVYISLGFFISACASMEIDSTAMEGIDANAYNEILKLEGYEVLFSVAIGYRDKDDFNQPSVKPKTRISLDKIVESI